MKAASSRPATHLSSGERRQAAKEGRTIPANLRRLPGSPAELRVVPGLYWHRITDGAGVQFFADTWKVAPEADRIGYRFKGGKPLEFVPRKQPFGAGSDPSNIVDACYPYGSIQVPGGTEPIVLHRDAVSGGGYFMVGTVISADMDLIGQLQPHSPARFVKVDMNGALQSPSRPRGVAEQSARGVEFESDEDMNTSAGQHSPRSSGPAPPQISSKKQRSSSPAACCSPSRPM